MIGDSVQGAHSDVLAAGFDRGQVCAMHAYGFGRSGLRLAEPFPSCAHANAQLKKSRITLRHGVDYNPHVCRL